MLGCYPIRKKIYDGLIQTCHVASIDHVSDIVTKPLGKYQFHCLSGKVGIHDIYALIWGEVLGDPKSI